MNRINATFLYALFFPFLYIAFVFGVYGFIDILKVVIDTSTTFKAFTTLGLVMWVLGSILIAAGFLSRGTPKVDTGTCQSCGYSLDGLQKRKCPECGQATND